MFFVFWCSNCEDWVTLFSCKTSKIIERIALDFEQLLGISNEWKPYKVLPPLSNCFQLFRLSNSSFFIRPSKLLCFFTTTWDEEEKKDVKELLWRFFFQASFFTASFGQWSSKSFSISSTKTFFFIVGYQNRSIIRISDSFWPKKLDNLSNWLVHLLMRNVKNEGKKTYQETNKRRFFEI